MKQKLLPCSHRVCVRPSAPPHELVLAKPAHLDLLVPSQRNMSPNYSLYLVTARSQVPSGTDYYASLRAALEGGVTMVQIREKDVDNGQFLEVARQSLAICDEVSNSAQE